MVRPGLSCVPSDTNALGLLSEARTRHHMRVFILAKLRVGQNDMKKDELSKLVIEALADDRFKWRTLKGIARQLDVDKDEIISVVEENPDIVVQSSIPSEKGEQLFATRDHFRHKSSGFDRFMGGIKGRI